VAQRDWISAKMKKNLFFVLSVLTLIVDQLTKAWATASLKPVGSIEVIPGFFRLTYALNRGVAFSLLADTEFEIRWVLASISALAALAVMGYLARTRSHHTRLNLSLSLLLAGIVGNLIDRVRLGVVVDFLDFHWADRFTWPTFNVADASICIGAVLLALELLNEEKVARVKAPAQTPSPEEGSVGVE
jgi:signal peptidase II